jgi:hypothetical protein
MATIHINRGGTNLGTFSEEDVRSGLRTAKFLESDLAWREGMAAWQPLSQFTEFASDLAAAAAAPATTPPSDAIPPASAAAQAAAIPSAPTPPPAQTVVPQGGLPWDRRAELGWFKAFIETLQTVLVRPTEAFTAMKREGGLWEPLLYALIGGTFGSVIGIAYRLGLQVVAGTAFSGSSDASWMFSAMGLVFLMIFSPLFVVIGAFLVAGVIHLCLLMVGGARRDFETTFRVVCFTIGSVNPLQVVPLCGNVVAGVWGLVLYCIGLSRAHETETGRAVLAVFLPLVICCAGALLLVVLAGGIGALSHNWR